MSGSSDVAAQAEQQKAEQEAKSSEAAFDAAKAGYKGLTDATKLKPGYGGLTGLVDAYGKGKDAVAAAREGDYGGAATNGLDALGGAAQAVAPALQKLAPSLLPGVLAAAGPLGVGAQVGTAVANAGIDASASNETLQKQFKFEGSANADGSPTSIIDAVRNTGDQVTQSLGGGTLGKIAGTTAKLVGAVGSTPLIIGSAGVGAAKYVYGQGKKLFGMGDG